jgi:hypothetical protein
MKGQMQRVNGNSLQIVMEAEGENLQIIFLSTTHSHFI